MSSIRVDEIMSEQVVTISVNDRLSTAEDIMRLGGVRHMPVVSSGCLVGVLSERDLLRASISDQQRAGGARRREFLGAVEIGAAMSAPPIVISREATLAEAARLMADHKVGCLPVVSQQGALVGLVTETDLLRYLASGSGA